MLLLARIVRLVTAVVVGFIVVGIALHLLDARAGNALVGFVYDVAGWLVTPFKGIFSPSGAKLRIAVNWGLAAVVYAIVGAVLARFLAGAGLAARERWATRRGRVAGV
jgi:xanthine/uracil permease